MPADDEVETVEEVDEGEDEDAEGEDEDAEEAPAPAENDDRYGRDEEV
jgi:hypothetical protein